MRIGKLIVSYKNYIFIALLALLTLKVIVPQLSDLQDSIAAVSSANSYWVLLGLFVFFLSVPLAALQLVVLALRPIDFGLTFRVQTAVLFVSKLFPQSIGGISLNVYYLMKKGHSAGQSAAVMAMDGFSNGIAYLILIIIGLLISPISLQALTRNIDISGNLITFIVILLAGAIYTVFHSVSIRKRIQKVVAGLKNNFASYKEKPLNVIWAGICNGLGSLTSIFVLWASAQAFGVELSFSSALLAYTFGNIASTIIPTPGGIGAVEAGIYAGLTLTGINGADATLITLLYRLITYWVPFIPGYYAFWSLRKNLLSGYSIHKTQAIT